MGSKIRKSAGMKQLRAQLLAEPGSETVVLTWDRIHSLATAHCGFSARTLAGLGVDWPPRKGWLSSLVGTRIPRALFDAIKTPEA